jgi:glycosyltransferase involved in cell wall biosynthesis
MLRESIWCFLQQDYPNKELIILNDHPEPIYLDRLYPNVHLFNMPHRFGSLGEKRNFSVSLARGEYLLPWDDDDLFLPWRVSDSLKRLLADPDKWAFKPNGAWMSTHNRDYNVVHNVFHNQIAMHRRAFDHAGGYKAMNNGEDIDFESRIPGSRWCRGPSRVDELVYVYRWGNNVTHISGLGMDRPGQPTAWEKVGEYHQHKKGGVIAPGFDRLYWQDLIEAAAANPAISAEDADRLAKRLAPYLSTGPYKEGTP